MGRPAAPALNKEDGGNHRFVLVEGADYSDNMAAGEEGNPKRMKRKEWYIGESRLYDVFPFYEPELERLNLDDGDQFVLDLCDHPAKKRDWAEFVPTMRGKVMRFEVVDEDEWEKRLNELLGEE